MSQPEATEPVRQAVDQIDGVLREVLADAGRFPAALQSKAIEVSLSKRKRGSA